MTTRNRNAPVAAIGHLVKPFIRRWRVYFSIYVEVEVSKDLMTCLVVRRYEGGFCRM